MKTKQRVCTWPNGEQRMVRVLSVMDGVATVEWTSGDATCDGNVPTDWLSNYFPMNNNIFNVLWPEYRNVHLEENREYIKTEPGGDRLTESQITAEAERRMKFYLLGDPREHDNSVRRAVAKIQSRFDKERNERERRKQLVAA